MDINVISGEIIDSAYKVHSVPGPGLLESAYSACLTHELRKRGLRVRTEVPLPIIYDGVTLEVGSRIDQIFEECVVTELKAVSAVLPVHDAQLLSHLKLSGYKLGLRINFHVVRLRDGIRRMVNELNEEPDR